MTDTTAPTMTGAEMLSLEASLHRLADYIFDSPAWGENTALGALAESDDDSLRAAAKVVHRLALDAKYPHASLATSYLPAPAPVAVAEPQSLRVQS